MQLLYVYICSYYIMDKWHISELARYISPIARCLIAECLADLYLLPTLIANCICLWTITCRLR